MSDQVIANAFERSFLSESLSKQIAECERYELAPLFLELFQENQPVLEAGCGSGRWCGWFRKHGIRSDGIDWSQDLCDRAHREIPESRFIACDMDNTPFGDGDYGGLIALGSIEHTIHGPLAILKEFHRLLRPAGVAVVTVPFGGRLRRTLRLLSRANSAVRSNNLLRRVLGRQPNTDTSLAQARRATKAEWYPRFLDGKNGWHFYEYEFNKEQTRTFLKDTGFVILREFVAFGNEGVLHNFGHRAGRWNSERCDVDLTILGRFLRKAIPVSACGHMLCYVVQKPGL